MTGKPTTDYIEATDGTGTPPAKTKAQVLSDVFSLATEFSTCVEAFNRIHPHKDNDHAQKVALAKLGLQQGRLLIFGDALGISAPPANIARHMIPSHPGLTNPDPHLPVNFGVRDARLDEEVTHAKIRAALHEMAGRPTNMSRDELMNAYGLKSPKAFSKLEYPALDTNRLEGFREKYNLLQDLVKQTGARTSLKRSMSMMTSHWTVRDRAKFEHYVKTVRTEVDALIDLMDVKEQVDRGVRSDLKSMGWHPDLTGRLVQQDWEKLNIIREACEVDYPEYLEVIDKALQYISEEAKETSLAQHRAALPTAPSAQEATSARRKSDNDVRNARRTSYKDVPEGPKSHLQLAAERALDPNYGKEKRPGWLSPTYSWFTGNNQAAASHDANETQETPTKTSDSRRNSTSNGAANSRRNSMTRRMSSSRRNSASHDAIDARRKSASHELEDARRSNSTSSAYKAIPEGPKTHLQLAAERALSPHAGQDKRPGWLSPSYSWFSGSHDAGSQEATSPRETTASHDAIEARRRSASQEVADAYRSSSVSSAYKAIPEAPKTHLQLAAERALDPYAGQEHRPSWLSMFKFKSWTKSGKQTETMQRSNSVSGAEAMDTQRSHSVGGYLEPLSEETNTLEPTRSKSLSAIPLPATNDLDVRMGKLSHEPAIQENGGEVTTYPERKPEGEELKKVDTLH